MSMLPDDLLIAMKTQQRTGRRFEWKPEWSAAMEALEKSIVGDWYAGGHCRTQTFLLKLKDDMTYIGFFFFWLHMALSIGSPQPLHQTHSIILKLSISTKELDYRAAFTALSARRVTHAELAHFANVEVPNRPGGGGLAAPLSPYRPGTMRLVFEVTCCYGDVHILPVGVPCPPSTTALPDWQEHWWEQKYWSAFVKHVFNYMSDIYANPRMFRLRDSQSRGTKGCKCGACHGCWKALDAKLTLLCGRCHHASYCSKECQKNDWKARHSTVCGLIAESLNQAEILALSDRGRVANYAALREFVPFLLPDLTTACYAATKLSSTWKEDQVLFVIVQPRSQSLDATGPRGGTDDDMDDSTSFEIVGATVFGPAALKFELMRFKLPVNTVELLLADVSTEVLRTKHGVSFESDTRWGRPLIVFDVKSKAIYSNVLHIPKHTFIEDQTVLLQATGHRKKDPLWEQRLKARAKVLAMKPQVGAKPPMSQREWRRWTEKL